MNFQFVWTILILCALSTISMEEDKKQELLVKIKLLTDEYGTTPEEVCKPKTDSRISIRKIKLFSGKVPVASGEVDFPTWKFLAEDVISSTLREEDKHRLLVNSLLRPAIDVVRGKDSEQIFSILNTTYGAVVSSRELLANLFSTYQGERESAADYLQKLYVLLLEAVDAKGINCNKMPELLTQQFVRGCHDEMLL